MWGEYVCTWFMWGSLLTCVYVGASHESHKSHVTSQPNTIWTKSRVQVEFGVGWRFLDPNNISCALSCSRTAHFFISNNVWAKYSFGWYLKSRKRSRTGSYTIRSHWPIPWHGRLPHDTRLGLHNVLLVGWFLRKPLTLVHSANTLPFPRCPSWPTAVCKQLCTSPRMGLQNIWTIGSH